MSFVKRTYLTILFLIITGCSKSQVIEVIYISGDVKINGINAVTGVVKEKEFSISTGKNSSMIAKMGSNVIFALSEETGVSIKKDSFSLISGRTIVSSDDELVIKSREVSVETEKSLFEIISKSNVSLVRNFSGQVFVKVMSTGTEIKGLILNENFSVEVINGTFSHSQSLGTDVVRGIIPLKDLSAFKSRDGSDLMNKISSECISLINSRYGEDIEQRYSLRTLSTVHGALSEVVTKSGKRIIGAVNVSGSKVTIYTVNGDVVMDVSQIKSMKRFGGD